MRRSAATSTARRGLPILCIVLLAAACSPGGKVERYLAEQTPFAATRLETGLIFPSPESARYLVTNWAPAHTWSTGTVYPQGTSATIRFFSVSDVPPTFVAEAMPVAPDSPTQTLTPLLNGHALATETMDSNWSTYEIALPAAALHVGWNELELRFTTTVPWPASQPGRPDPPPRAARFRKIELRSGLGRPYRPDGPMAVTLADQDTPSASSGAAAAIPIELAPDRFEDFSAAAIDMATDSLMELYLLPAPETRLAGEVATEGLSGETNVVVEIVDDNGPTRVFETGLAADEVRSVEADLSAWAEKLVRLRIRVFGTANGTVRWTGLRTVSTTEPPGAPDRPDLRFLLDPTNATEHYGSAMRPDALLAPPRSGSLGRPDIFLIVLDAARADRFEGTLGEELSPRIQALAGDGTAFSRAWAPSSWTGQSIPALLAGMYPDAIGIENWASRLPPQATTFPELLAAAGYHTVLWSQHPIYSRRPALRDGFEAYENAAPAAVDDPSTIADLTGLLEEERPTFAMIHLLPPHTPYAPPAPFAGSRSSWYDDKVPINDETLNQFDLLFAIEQPALRDEIRRAAIARYEENVSFADHLVGRLVDDLRRAGRYDDALIIVTADHGEAFYEHGMFLH
ncbi:MAG: sulfatase-like hydrolase/transferase, partial [Acidobacteriota bacterium]